MSTYRVFTRNCTNWREFSSSNKTTKRSNLTLSEAREFCKVYNSELTEYQKSIGHKAEFESE